MTEAEELLGTFLKFWRAGRNAHLNIECHAGKVWATLRINLPQPPPPHPEQHHQPHRHVGPSRLRRRARRAASRSHAAVEAADSTEDKVVPATEKETDETGNSEKEVKDSGTAAQAASIAVKAKPITRYDDVVTVVEDIVEKQKEESLQLRPASSLNVLARPWSSSHQQEVMIKFGKDEFYQDKYPTPQVLTNQCEKCGKTFGSSRALKTHQTKEHQISSM